MQLSENSRFITLTLGAAVLLFSLIERVCFAMKLVDVVVGLSSIAIALGALLLLLGRRRPI